MQTKSPRAIVLSSLVGLAGCATNMEFGPDPTTYSYTVPEDSALAPVRPYSNPDDVCQVIRENKAIREPVNDGTFLIACPKHERGAISDRLGEGADIIGHAKHWTVLVVSPAD